MKKITCSLCGCAFNVEPFTSRHRGDVVLCNESRADGSKCERRFQHANSFDNENKIVMRVDPADVDQMMLESKGLA